MANKKKILKAIFTSSSLLLVIIILLLVLYANSFSVSSIFPKDTSYWNKILTGYLVIFSITIIAVLIFSRRTLLELVKANYWKSFIFSYIPNAIFSIILLLLIRFVIQGNAGLGIWSLISYMPIYVLFIHLFVVTQVEEILFKGLIYNSIVDRSGNRNAGTIVSLGAFAIWHFAKTGGNFVATLVYVPLRYWWNFVSEKGIPYLNKIRIGKVYPFAPTPRTCQAGAGQHFAWNMFIIGAIAPFRT